jgi:hypothetical protein
MGANGILPPGFEVGPPLLFVLEPNPGFDVGPLLFIFKPKLVFVPDPTLLLTFETNVLLALVWYEFEFVFVGGFGAGKRVLFCRPF